MKTQIIRTSLRVLLVWSLIASPWLHAAPIETVFTYQGELKRLGTPANGPFDLRFTMFDAATGGGPLVSALTLENVDVSNGIFTVELNFGLAPYSGSQLWLEIEVRNGSETGAYTALTPRQKITASPYAIHAEFVAMDSIGALEADSSEVQLRVASCDNGTAIRSVNEDGSVVCESAMTGPAGPEGPEGPQGDGLATLFNYACPSLGACDDNDICTSSDEERGAIFGFGASGEPRCGNTPVTCSGIPISCDDGNVCTTESCDPALGCVFTLASDGTLCDDGNPATSNDHCSSGVCVGYN